MSFKHKISRRLAALIAVTAAIVYACELPVTTTPPTNSVAQLIISPKAVAVQPNQDADLTAVGLTTSGDTADISVTWSATAGTVTDAGTNRGNHYGRYRNGTCGDFKVAATSSPGDKSDTASVTVTCGVPVATVDVTPPSASVIANQTVQLTATPKDASGNALSGRVVTWASSNTGVATVSASGLVTGKAAGTATITATSEAKSGSAAITVTAVPVASVAVTPAAASVAEGNTVQLTATPKDASGSPLTGRTVTWTTSDATVATVSASGLVRGVTAGPATITATSEGHSGTAAITVTVPPPPPPPGTIGQTLLTAGADPANQQVYTTASISPAANALVTVAVLEHNSSSAPPVPTLSGGGMSAWTQVASVTFDNGALPHRRLTIFRAMSAAPGSGPITITSSVTLSNCQWIVSQWVGVATSGLNGADAIGQTGALQGDAVSGLTVPLTAFANPNNVGYGAFGVASNAAAVTPGAGFTAIGQQPSGEGTAGDLAAEWATNLNSIAATWSSLNGAALGVEIRAGNSGPPVPVASVDVTPPSASVDVGQTVQLTATPRDASGNPLARAVSWTSSNTAVATVNSSGLVAGKTAGTATITATSEGMSGSSAITVVIVPVAAVTVAPATATVQAGLTTQLTATPKDASGNPLAGRTVTWTSDNTAVATVNGSGLVTGVVAGTATITATSEGHSGTSAITVTAAPVPVATVAVAPPSASVDEGKTVQLTATPKDANGTPLSGRVVTWTSSNTAAATVSASGLVTGKVAGTATITATSEGKSGTSAITVVRVPVASVAVAPAAPSVQEGFTVQLTATPKDASGTPLTGRAVTWQSSNTGIATVSASGLVTGVVPGGATITATSEGQSGTSAVTVTPKPPPGTGVVFVGAGDISDCGNNNDEATAQLLDGISGTVFTVGDNVYSSGTATQYAQCYDPTWGRHKARTKPSPGNHDYNTSGATGYYGYFGAAAGDPAKGYYSYDLGDWHLIALNSEISVSAGSAQEQWLRADLAASTKRCTLAYWHKPRFSSGTHGSSTTYTPLWQVLYDFNADVVLVGHDHNYQRFAPQTPAGVADPARGIREFVVGTGGESHYVFTTPIANTEAYNTDTFGVLKLTLNAGSYTWEFIPVAGKTYRDSGSGSCH